MISILFLGIMNMAGAVPGKLELKIIKVAFVISNIQCSYLPSKLYPQTTSVSNTKHPV